MQAYALTPHPAHEPLGVSSIEARCDLSDPHWLRLRWRVEGSGALAVPPFAGKGRADELWRATCFELFLKPAGGEGYVEFNLSPSERWNAYQFDSWREGMREWPMPRDPVCTIRPGRSFAIFDAALPRDGLPEGECAMGLSAVIEETGGRTSYWALAHPGEGKPDFHDPACFAARLAAPATG